jgi:hypothetical protein
VLLQPLPLARMAERRLVPSSYSPLSLEVSLASLASWLRQSSAWWSLELWSLSSPVPERSPLA